MPSKFLSDALTRPPVRTRVIDDCSKLIDEEIAAKGGLTGIAFKGAYRLVKAVRATFVRDVIDAMLDEWVSSLEPFHEEWRTGGGRASLADFLSARREAVAEKLLEVTDSRAQRVRTVSIKSLYARLRPTAKRHEEEAVPRLGSVVERRLREEEKAASPRA